MNIFTDILAMISPRAATQYMLQRGFYESLRSRKHESASWTRQTKGWRATNGSADAELSGDLTVMRARMRDLTRNNPLAAAALRRLTAYIVGTGITPRASHPNKALAKKAQRAWNKWARGRVDGKRSYYQLQKLAVRSTIEGGDCVLRWEEYKGVPDARVRVLEGDYIDHTLSMNLDNGGRIVQGVEFDSLGNVVAYHLFDQHPGDLLGGVLSNGVLGLMNPGVRRVPAEFIDHVYEDLRAGQTRGVPWFSPSAIALRENSDMAEARRTKMKIESCLAVFRSPGVDAEPETLGASRKDEGRTIETLRPGMIVTGKPGETLNVVNPAASGGHDAFYRSEMMKIAAGIGVPYHIMTGDVSQANYSSLRADIVVFYILLDDWVWNTFVPKKCDPAWERVMRREALLTGDFRLTEVMAEWTPPARPWVDPYKDILALAMEMRLGGKSFAQMCAERGEDWREKLAQWDEEFGEIDKIGAVFDFDGRKVNSSGSFQPRPLSVDPAADTTQTAA